MKKLYMIFWKIILHKPDFREVDGIAVPKKI